MNLDALTTTTTVEFDEGLEADEVVIGDEPTDAKTKTRVVQQLDRIRAEAKISTKARVHSHNNFPTATGLASSASAYAALTLAGTRAAGLELSERNLSIMARLGSGSAARSVPAGFVEWFAATNTTSTSDLSYARQVMPPDAWDLKDVIAVVSHDPKKVGSSEGHAAVNTSPFLGERISRLPIRYHKVRRELLNKNLQAMGAEIEAEAIELHMLAMTSRPPIFYWAPATVRVMDAVRQWREEGLACYYTLDAGPNVHILTQAKDAEEVAKRLHGFSDVLDVIVSGAGGGARGWWRSIYFDVYLTSQERHHPRHDGRRAARIEKRELVCAGRHHYGDWRGGGIARDGGCSAESRRANCPAGIYQHPSPSRPDDHAQFARRAKQQSLSVVTGALSAVEKTHARSHAQQHADWTGGTRRVGLHHCL